MKVRFDHPRFGRTTDVHGGACYQMAVELRGGALYGLSFIIVGKDAEADTFIATLHGIERIMPPITPQAESSKAGDGARLPMCDEYGYSASLEADQRRKEWAELRA